MASQIAIFEGLHPVPGGRKMPRKRKHSQRSKFAHTAKMCSRKVRRSGGSFRACMRQHLKKGGSFGVYRKPRRRRHR